VTGGGLSTLRAPSGAPARGIASRHGDGGPRVKAVKTIAALIFVTALALVLVQPVLSADDEPSPPAQGGAPPTEDVELIARYPERCLRPLAPISNRYVAARRGPIALIGPPGGRPVSFAGVDGDVAWSPSGRYLAEAGGRVYDQAGEPRGRLFYRPVEWGWSPVADCALAVTENGMLTYSIAETRRLGIRLLNAAVVEFAFSPNGRRLAVVIEGRGLFVADLAFGDLVQATAAPPSLAGWFSNRSVLYSKSEGSGKLRFATGSGKTGIVRGGRAGGTFVRCRDGGLLVSLASEATPPLAEIVSRGGGLATEVLRGPPPRYDGYSDATCSPNGRRVAASALKRSGARGPLLLLRSDGTFVRVLARGRTANPEWADEGLLFVKFGAAGRGRLWFAQPGEQSAPTDYRVGGPGQYDWHTG
jgi:hypothetical protein